MTDMIPIELMGISEDQAALIRDACTGAKGSIRVKDLDKGLSGARVLLAQWPLQAETESALHVLKIGKLQKLSEEYERVTEYVSPVDPQVGHIRLFKGPAGSDTGLLRQAFAGAPDGTLKSLRGWIDEARDAAAVRKQISSLYSNRMRQWHCRPGCIPPSEEKTFDQIFEGEAD